MEKSNMDTAIQKKITEYKQKHIPKPLYVVEIGSHIYDGVKRSMFDDADNFCEISNERGPGIDIVHGYDDIDRLFDFNPDVIICLDVLCKKANCKKIINAVRETLMPGGYLILSFKNEGEGSYIDAFFNGYEVFDVSTVERTICGIARKPLK